VSGWCWFALVDDPPVGALASASATDVDGAAAGTFAAWPAGRKPVASALRMDARLVDPAAPAGWVSLVTIPRALAPLFDDPAVNEAMRAVLRGPAPVAVSTLVRDATTFAGAVTVRRDRYRLADDPFTRLHPARLLHAGPGLFATVAPPAGPVIQRYAGKPWPASGFLD